MSNITVNERVRRVFQFNGANLTDPDPNLSVEEVKKVFAANGDPTLTNASVTGPETANGKQTFTFKAAVGTKG
jgi:PRTRC genetic system protein C